MLFLVGATFFVLLPACGIGGTDWPWMARWCSPDRSSARSVDDLDLERAALEREIAALERDIAGLRCEAADERRSGEGSGDPEEAVAGAQCLPGETARPPEELVIVVDNSGSMSLSIDLPRDVDGRLRRASKDYQDARVAHAAGQRSEAQLARMEALKREQEAVFEEARTYPGESRISVAKRLTIDAVDKAPQGLPIGLFSFYACKPWLRGAFGSTERDALKKTVDSLVALGGTPLALSVARAAASFEGGTRLDDPVTLLVISDGGDSCRGDPCMAAREAKRARPGLVINVVDLSAGASAANSDVKCLAELTGGFYRHKPEGMSREDLARSIREGAGYEGRGLCRAAAAN